MPNFWTKTTQYFDEAFKGPRTIDIEFDELIKEMNNIEKGINQFKQVLNNIKVFSSSFKSYFSCISEALRNIYSKNSPFSNLIQNIVEIHKQLEIRCDLYSQVMLRLIPKTTEWSNFFQQAKDHLDNREKARKELDHYDGKMESMYRNNSKKAKGEYLERNQNKFCQAAMKYIEMSEETYHVISDIMNKRYEMINPVLLELIVEQREFLRTEGEINMKLDQIEDKFVEIQKSDVLYVHKDYNASKYIRGGLLLHKTSTSSDKRRFTGEDIKKTFLFGKQQSYDVLGFEMAPTTDKKAYKRRRLGLVAEKEQMEEFYWIADLFSGVSTRFAKQPKKDKTLLKRSYTEPSAMLANKSSLDQNQQHNQSKELFNDFF